MRGIAFLSFLVVLACSAVEAPRAADREVDIELVLAADISRSMDLEEAELQRQGYVRAIRHPRIIGAIRAGALGRIAVTYIEWSGAYDQQTLVGWTEISDETSAEAFAAALERADVRVARRTSISSAMITAAASFEGNGFAGRRRIIDISGDGPNNAGDYVVDARDRVVAGRIVINGLPIVSNRPNPSGFPSLANLDHYYEDCVIGGTGAFLVVAHGFHDFARAIRRKMLLEIAGVTPPRPLLHLAADGDRPPCDIGERQLQERMMDLN
ncbi:MAG: DUF1194 domain-containing protein [Rhodospirillaceae bacterium]